MKGYKSNYDIEIGECSKNTPKLHVYAGLVEGVKPAWTLTQTDLV